MPVPANPKIYHITAIANLRRIVPDEELVSDAVMIERGGPEVEVGMSNIKKARLARPVECHPGLMVGGCVPFYFCSRSVMLYLLHMSNHPDLGWREGQEPIVHLEADLREAVAWADHNRRRWAFSLSNARAVYAEFRRDLDNLGEIDWGAVAANTWSGNGVPVDTKENKQAEFLVDRSFPWRLVTRIGVLSRRMFGEVQDVLATARHKPKVEIRSNWYY
jgi:ssDNA thymidine ADP-ribosyltransferase, DarT